MCIYIYIYIYIYTCIYIHTYICTCIYTHVNRDHDDVHTALSISIDQIINGISKFQESCRAQTTRRRPNSPRLLTVTVKGLCHASARAASRESRTLLLPSPCDTVFPIVRLHTHTHTHTHTHIHIHTHADTFGWVDCPVTPNFQ